MAAGVSDTLWSLADMVRVIEAWEGRRVCEDQCDNLNQTNQHNQKHTLGHASLRVSFGT
jgi:hypothetical protein